MEKPLGTGTGRNLLYLWAWRVSCHQNMGRAVALQGLPRSQEARQQELWLWAKNCGLRGRVQQERGNPLLPPAARQPFLEGKVQGTGCGGAGQECKGTAQGQVRPRTFTRQQEGMHMTEALRRGMKTV